MSTLAILLVAVGSLAWSSLTKYMSRLLKTRYSYGVSILRNDFL